MNDIGSKVGSAGMPGRPAERPLRFTQPRISSPDTYLKLAQLALRYDHSGMAFQVSGASAHHVAFFKKQIEHGDVAARAISSILLGFVGAARMCYEDFFEQVVPAAQLLNVSMPFLSVGEVVPVRATADSLAGLGKVLPYSTDNHRPIERVVEVVHRSLITLIDHRAKGGLTDDQVSNTFTVMGVELIPYAVKSHAELLGRLVRSGQTDEAVVSNTIASGVGVLNMSMNHGVTPEVCSVAQKCITSIMNRLSSASPTAAGVQTYRVFPR